ncbi:MAG: hypothetical protein ACREE4_01260 [Stellaceae bacterium]
MSALGHYLEEEGIATVAISLIRPQTERTRPPRALWVPFELGRPFGPPGDPAFQKRVILAALHLLEGAEGPGVIADFPEDDPRARPDPAWHPPVLPAALATGSGAALAAALASEIEHLRSAHGDWVARHGRTTVGLSGLAVADCARLLGGWLRGEMPTRPRAGFSAPLMLRFAVDDIKSYCLEAAAAGTAMPSSRQLGDWLWNGTATGVAIQVLRAAHLASADERLKLIAGSFLVPAARVRGGG